MVEKTLDRKLNIQPMNSRALEGQTVPDPLMTPVVLHYL